MQPSAYDEPQQVPEPKPPPVKTSPEPPMPAPEEGKPAAPAVEAPPMTQVNGSMKRDKAPEFKLTSAMAGPYTDMRPQSTPTTASLRLNSVMPNPVPKREPSPKMVVKEPMPQRIANEPAPKPIEQPKRASMTKKTELPLSKMVGVPAGPVSPVSMVFVNSPKSPSVRSHSVGVGSSKQRSQTVK